MPRPNIKKSCPADQYADRTCERIVEFSGRNGGGLIAIRDDTDGTMTVSVYEFDPTVQVAIGRPRAPVADPSKVRAIEAARARYASDEIEIDDHPMVSQGTDGAFVAAWLWVPAAEDDA